MVLLFAARQDGRAAPPPGGPPPVPVEIAPVKTATLRDATEYMARLSSRRSVRVQPQVDGWVTAINVASGDRVSPGTVLMEIDSRRQRAAVRGQQASRAARVANLEYWRQQHARLQRLFDAGGASRQELDQAESSLNAAEAQVAAESEQLRAEAVQLRYFRVAAPEAGTVGDIPVRVGDLVTPQTMLTTIDQNDWLEVYVEVPVVQASRVRLEAPIEVLDERGQVLARTSVTFVSPRVSPEQTVLVKGLVDNRDGRLRSAQAVRARVVFGEHDAPVVPVLAVQMRGGEAFVWSVRQDAGGPVAEQRVVKLGPINGQVYPVLSGLKPGEPIVVSGIQKLRPGARVSDLKASSPQPGAR